MLSEGPVTAADRSDDRRAGGRAGLDVAFTELAVHKENILSESRFHDEYSLRIAAIDLSHDSTPPLNAASSINSILLLSSIRSI
jgi:hypothetical protein